MKTWKWGWGSEMFDGLVVGFLLSLGGMDSLSWGGVNSLSCQIVKS